MRRSTTLRCMAMAAFAVATALIVAAPPGFAVTIELDDVAPDRIERQRAFADGALPLPGTPRLGHLDQRLANLGVKMGVRIFLRIFKAESELEVWVHTGKHYKAFATYPICHWAGTLGPKLREGDKQNPEGFYSVGRRQLRRQGRWPHSLNIGFPNQFDRAHKRTGSYILLHGGCSSIGCFAMTNAVMAEIFTLVRAAIRRGQPRVPIHVFPFRMTAANLRKQEGQPWFAFWANLKQAYDAFEATKVPPRIGLCDKRYVIEPMGPGDIGALGRNSPLRRVSRRGGLKRACAAARQLADPSRQYGPTSARQGLATQNVVSATPVKPRPDPAGRVSPAVSTPDLGPEPDGRSPAPGGLRGALEASAGADAQRVVANRASK